MRSGPGTPAKLVSILDERLPDGSLGLLLLAFQGTSSKLGDAAAIVLPCRSSPSLFDPVLPALLPESDSVEHSKPRRCALPRSPLKCRGASWDQLYC
jgi:hypothetical protein